MSTALVIVIIVSSLILKFAVKLLNEGKFGTPNPNEMPMEEGSDCEDMEAVLMEGDPSAAPAFNNLIDSAKASKMAKNRDSANHPVAHSSFEQRHPKGETGAENRRNGENSGKIEDIAENFDLRSAVIYSEIMSPKFKDNE